jgi:glucosamine-6-phosphate deaminase
MRQNTPLRTFRIDQLRVEVHSDRAAAGAAAADLAARAIAAACADRPVARVVFAAAPSQDEFLAELEGRVADWSRVVGYHMDEYLGISADYPASFRRYLWERLFHRIPAQVRLIQGDSPLHPAEVGLAYERLLRAEPPDLVCAGIGENGHLAFNDPPVADFLDPLWVKVVRLDRPCRVQQFNDSCFERLEDVPTHAYTLTIPALCAAPTMTVVVPGPRKAEAVRATLMDPIDEACPATILRRHPGATLFLDPASASALPEGFPAN